MGVVKTFIGDNFQTRPYYSVKRSDNNNHTHHNHKSILKNGMKQKERNKVIKYNTLIRVSAFAH